MELQAESRGLPALSCDSGALSCVPPWEADRATIIHACRGQATSWENLRAGRLKCSPEPLMKSSGSPMTQKNPPAFSNGVNSLVLVNLLAGGYSRYFCLQLPAQPFLHKAALTVAGLRKCVLQFPTGANHLPSPTTKPRALTWLCFCCPWSVME